MATFELESDEPVLVGNPNNKALPYQTAAVDLAYHNRRQLLTHVSGMRWELKGYWSQYLGMDDDTESQSLDREAVFQSYLKIEKFEMRVSQPLDITVDDTSREFALEGSATMYPGFIPNQGDMFVAEIGDGRDMIFTISQVEKKTMLLDAVYEVSYHSIDYATPERLEDLNSKTVKTVTFVKDFLALGKDSFLVASEYHALEKIRKWMSVLPKEYIKEFFVEEHGTLLVPEQPNTLYDPFLATFVHTTMSTHRIIEFQRLRLLNCDTGTDAGYTTLFDTFLNRDERGLDFAQLFLIPFNVATVKRLPTYASVHYSGIINVMFPKDDKSLGAHTETVLTPSPARNFNRPVNLKTLIHDTTLEGIATPDLVNVVSIKPVTCDEYYVLSKAFYEQNPVEMSVLELMLSKYYTRTPLDISALLSLCERSVYWGKLERYYYIPLLCFLLTSAQGDVN